MDVNKEMEADMRICNEDWVHEKHLGFYMQLRINQKEVECCCSAEAKGEEREERT